MERGPSRVVFNLTLMRGYAWVWSLGQRGAVQEAETLSLRLTTPPSHLREQPLAVPPILAPWLRQVQ